MVGQGINETTKGIWIWPELKKKENMNTKILFFDCESISGGESSIFLDGFIFFLLFFISSAIIHNTTSNIDQNGISEISILNSMTETFNIKVIVV